MPGGTVSGTSLIRVPVSGRRRVSTADVARALRVTVVVVLALLAVAFFARCALISISGPAGGQLVSEFVIGLAVLPLPTVLVLALAGVATGGARSPVNLGLLVGVIGWFLLFASMVTFDLAPLVVTTLLGTGLGLYSVGWKRALLGVWALALNLSIGLGAVIVHTSVAYM